MWDLTDIKEYLVTLGYESYMFDAHFKAELKEIKLAALQHQQNMNDLENLRILRKKYFSKLGLLPKTKNSTEENAPPDPVPTPTVESLAAKSLAACVNKIRIGRARVSGKGEGRAIDPAGNSKNAAYQSIEEFGLKFSLKYNFDDEATLRAFVLLAYAMYCNPPKSKEKPGTQLGNYGTHSNYS